MSANIGRAEIGTWKSKALRLRSRMAANRAATSRTIETIVHTSEVSSAAFVAGVAQGRWHGIQFLGVPLDLGLAVALHVGAFIGLAGKASPHLHGFGDGFLAAFLTTTGYGVGHDWAKKSKLGPAATSGALPGQGGSYLTEDDRRMAAMADNV